MRHFSEKIKRAIRAYSPHGDRADGSFCVRAMELGDARTGGYSISLRLLHYATLLDTGLLACKTAEVVKFCATYLTILVDGD